MNYFKLLLYAVIVLYFKKFQEYVGMLSGQEAVDYYSEAHTKDINSLIHTIGMPFTMYGMYMWIPGLFSLNRSSAKFARDIANTVYISHYAQIDLKTTIYVILLFIIPLMKAGEDYERYGPKRSFKRGIAFSVIALCCQEYFGHYLQGDMASRPEGVPNAVLYAPYYAAHWVVDKYSFFN